MRSTFRERRRNRLSLAAFVALVLTVGLVGVSTVGLVGVSAFALIDLRSAIALSIACVVALVVVLRTARRLVAIAVYSVVVLALALTVVVALYLQSFPRWVVRDTDMGRWITTELPPGSGAARVRAFLRMHAEPNEIVESFIDSQGAVIYADIEPNYDDLFCHGDLQITFYLGHVNHLSHHDIVERPVCL